MLSAYCYCPTAFCFLLSIVRPHRRFDIPAHVEVTFNIDAQRIAGFHKVFENHINRVFVKDFYLAKRVDVELQTLQFDATLVRHILDPNRRKVRKVREGTDASKLRHFKLNLDLAAGKLIRKSVERIKVHLFARRRANIKTLNISWREFRQWS